MTTDMMPCGKHSLVDADTAAMWDGLCPICLEARLAAAEKVVKAVAGYHTDCCGLATKPEYACMHDMARAALTQEL